MSKTPTPGRFLVLAENQSAAQAVRDFRLTLLSKKPHGFPSPLYLHGPSGTGKTCLIHALIAELGRGRSPIHAASLSARDLAFSAEDLREERFECLEALRQAPLAVVEDVQFLPVPAARALVSLLDQRDGDDRPTLISAAMGPRHLHFRGERFPARLTSRLAAGLVVAISPLSAASREILLGDLAQRKQLPLSRDVLTWLAENLTGGGRQLEGAISQLETLARLGPLTLTLVRQHFGPQFEALRPGIGRIAQGVGDYFHIRPQKLQSRRRFRNIVMPRQVGMYLARQLTGLSLQQIGDYFGGHDHTTVLYACQKIEEAMKTDAVLSGAVHQLHAELG